VHQATTITRDNVLNVTAQATIVPPSSDAEDETKKKADLNQSRNIPLAQIIAQHHCFRLKIRSCSKHYNQRKKNLVKEVAIKQLARR
jgi:hypothetical protein